MYSVYAGNTCIYDDTSNDNSLRLINPVLELSDSAAGSFKMTVPITNIGYDLIERLTTTISIVKDGDEMWAGRVIDESIDFWKNRTLTCEGELAYLNDSTQPPAEYHNLTVRGFLETLIAIHNSKVSEDRQFTVGAVTVTDPNDSLYRYTNFEKTIECINDKLVERLGGHLVVRKENGVRYLDYLADKVSTNTQLIEFGTNLLDYTASFDMTEYATVVVPLGEKLEESPIAALDAYLTVAEVNDGSVYVQNAEAVSNFGWIEKVVHFDRVTEPANLLRKAQEYLSELQFDSMVLEVKAVDLHYMNPETEGVKLSDQIRVVSEPHGLNRVFPVMKLSIPLDQPENTLFTLGSTITTSLTSENNKTNTEIMQRIEELPTKQSVLDEARDNAAAIMDLAANGFITITHGPNGSQELYIANNIDLQQATKFWRWNVNGLAYGEKAVGSDVSTATYTIAMTMDGSIVADKITSGTLRADLLDAVKIRASSFIIENESDPSGDDETLESKFQRFEISDQQLVSEISGVRRVAIKTVEVHYALGTSSTVAPTDDWSTTAPTWEAGKYMWQKTKTIFADSTVQLPHESWSDPTCIQGAKGEPGNNGGNTAIVYLYKRSATAPTIDWNYSVVYDFEEKILVSFPVGWYRKITDVPASTEPLYVTAATAYSQGDNDTIPYTEWSTPVKLVENGTNGLNSATVFLYQRAPSTPAKPSIDLTYTFSNGALSTGYSPWQRTIPAVNGNPCYVIQATAISSSTADTILQNEWSNQTILVEDGTDGVGISSVVPEYCLSTSASTQPSTGWTTSCPAWQENKYIWTRSHVYYDDGTDETTTPVLDNAVNGLGESYTRIHQTMNSLSLVASSTSETMDVPDGEVGSFTPWSAIYVEDGSPAFNFVQVGEWIVSDNEYMSSSFAYGTLEFNFSQETKIIVQCECKAETDSSDRMIWDYGIISDLDFELRHTRTADSTGVKYSFYGAAYGTSVDLEYVIPSGSHYITFKYIKDSFIHVIESNDYMKIRAYKVKSVVAGGTSTISLTGTGISTSSADIQFTGVVTFNDLMTAGSTVIDGSNIKTGSIKADFIDTTNLRVETVYYGTHEILSSTIDQGPQSADYVLNIGFRQPDNRYDFTYIRAYADYFQIRDPDNNAYIEISQGSISPSEDDFTQLGRSGHSFSALWLNGYQMYADSRGRLFFNGSQIN